jgi:hypothetical protein
MQIAMIEDQPMMMMMMIIIIIMPSGTDHLSVLSTVMGRINGGAARQA